MCQHSDALEPDWCTLCLADRSHAGTTIEMEPPNVSFVAVYSTRCSQCDGMIQVDEEIKPWVDGEWVHKECP